MSDVEFFYLVGVRSMAKLLTSDLEGLLIGKSAGQKFKTIHF